MCCVRGGATRLCRVWRYERGVRAELQDEVPREAMVHLETNGERLATFLCSPTHLEALGVGYLVASGFLQARDELQSVHVLRSCDIIIDVHMASRPAQEAGDLHVARRTQDATPVPLKGGPGFHADELLAVMDRLLVSGEVFRRTGGTHFAAIVDPAHGCEPVVFFEDIGRHNAIDKAVGGAFLGGHDLGCSGLVVSCRLSREALGKAARAGLPLVASRAGPTDEAIALAERLGITLVGFARGGRMNMYTHSTRVV